MYKNTRLWRDSSSIIALVKNNEYVDNKKCDYKVLFQKRSNKSAFLPKTIVFPGGTTEECDSYKHWYEYFKSFNIADDKFKQFHSKNFLYPPIFQKANNLIHSHVSLRITAIRETFEELGILICRQNTKTTDNTYAQFITDFDVKHWQKKIHKDPMEFISLCQYLKCYPDIWSLYLWSNWLTPIGYENQRFDTIFFITGFETQPPVFADNTEVSEVWWSSPSDVIKKFEEKNLILPPPQWYEISKLKHQKQIDALLKFSAARSCYGCEQVYPILLYPKKGKGWLAIFPGDELYPIEPDFDKQTIVPFENKTIDELQDSATVTHRMELYDLYTLKVQLKNFSPFQYQLSPLNGNIPILQHNNNNNNEQNDYRSNL